MILIETHKVLVLSIYLMFCNFIFVLFNPLDVSASTNQFLKHNNLEKPASCDANIAYQPILQSNKDVIQNAMIASRERVIPQILSHGFSPSFSYNKSFLPSQNTRRDNIFTELIQTAKQIEQSQNQISLTGLYKDSEILEVLLQIHQFLGDASQVLPILIELEDKIINALKTESIQDQANIENFYSYLNGPNSFEDLQNLILLDANISLNLHNLTWLMIAKNKIFLRPESSFFTFYQAIETTIMEHFNQSINDIPIVSTSTNTLEDLKVYFSKGIFIDNRGNTNFNYPRGSHTHILQAYLTAKFLDKENITINGIKVLASDIYTFLSKPNKSYLITSDGLRPLDPWTYVYDMKNGSEPRKPYTSFGSPQFIYHLLNNVPVFPFLSIK